MYDKEFDKSLQFNSLKDIGNLKNIFYYNNLNNKLDQEVGDFLQANTPNPKLYSNALRHQYVSALYARNLGDDVAKRLGDLNELTNLSGSGREDKQIDEINNEIGRRYGLQYQEMPREELLFKLLTDYDANNNYVKNKLKK